MAITVGTLIVDLEANTASFVSGLDKAGQMSLNSSTQIRRAFETMATAAAGAFIAAEAAIVAAVEHAISNAARLHDVAQATGTTTAALSALEYAAKQSGLSTEQLDKGLEKMAKSALAAASAGRDGQSAYKTLGVSVTDANRQLRPTQDILVDLATKFRSMPDGPMKTALAIQIFGRAGAELVPLLNRGKEGITGLMEEAKKLGLVIDDATAIAAKHFEESMIKVKSRAEGAATALAEKLLPALNFTLDRMNQSPPSGGWLNVTATTLIASVAVLRTWLDFLQSIGSVLLFLGGETVAVFNAVGAAAIGTSKALVFDFAGAEKEYKAGYSGFIDQLNIFSRDWKNVWSDNRSYIEGLFKKPVPNINTIADQFMAASRGFHPGAPSGDAAAGEKAAAAIERKIAALEAAAAAESKLAAAEQGEAAATIFATAAAQAEKEIRELNAQATQHHVSALNDNQKARIISATLEKAFADAADQTSKRLADESLKINQQTAAVRAMTAAYAEGGAAIAKAEEDAKLAPYRAEVERLQQAFEQAIASGDKFSAQTLGKMAGDLARARTNLAAMTAAVQQFTAAERAENTGKLIVDTDRYTASQRLLTQALLGGAAAMREQFIAQKASEFQADPKQDQSRLNEYIAALRAQLDVQRLLATEEKLDSTRRRKDLEDELDALRRLRAQLVANGATTLDIDAKIHTLELQKIHDQADLLLQMESVGAGAKAFFLSYGKNATDAQRAFDILSHGMDELTTNLAKALTGQKVSWHDFLTSLAEEFTKFLLNKAFQRLFGFLGGLLGGTGGGGGGGFSLASLPLTLGFGIGGLAAGGPATAGTLYQVNEGELEFFRPNVSGTVIPLSAGPGAAASPTAIYQTINIQTPDVDSFRRSREQIAGDMAAAAARSARRR